MDTAQWPQESGGLEKAIMDQEMGSNAACTRSMIEKRARPQEQLNCPRCNSTNTKFCYYNNYSLTQPRYFCKTCRRYWTEGGTLRNVPVGGGSRKNKKSTSSSSSPSSSKIINNIPDLNPPRSLSQFTSISLHQHQNPRSTHQGQDLNLSFSAAMEHNYHANPTENKYNNGNQQQNPDGSTTNSSPLSALELLRTGIASRGVNSFIPGMPPDSNGMYSTSGFSLQEFKPSQLGFCVDGLGNRYHGDHDQEINGGRMLFPFGDHHIHQLKQIPSSGHHDHHQVLDHHQNKGQANPTGYWNGLLGGGSW